VATPSRAAILIREPAIVVAVAGLLGSQSNRVRDQLILVLGLVSLAVVLPTYALEFAIQEFNIQIPSPAFLLILALPTVVNSAFTALIILIGWAIQRRRMGAPILFLVFVVAELTVWAIGTGARVLWYYRFSYGPIGNLSLVTQLFNVAGVAGYIALFLLLILALPEGILQTAPQPYPPQPYPPQPGMPP